MNKRSYNKLYVNKNRDEGSQRLLLGYKHDEKEIIFAKDKETYFHVPLFSESIYLTETDLIENGAIGGTFPAASDRIYKNLKNYGDYTPHGSPTTYTDGMWFCSWLFQETNLSQPVWLDRFYAPGKFNFNKANEELNLPPSYESNNFVFVDKPSTLLLEPGVLYKYFHLGEGTFNSLLSTCGGPNNERLVLSLTNWNIEANTIDTSNNKLPSYLNSSGDKDELFVQNFKKQVRLLPPTINFDNNQSITSYVNYDESYVKKDTLLKEFSWTLWCNSNNWLSAAPCQLVGNLTTKGGGMGLFLEDLTSTPLTVILETSYGHALVLNEIGQGILDKSLQDTSLPVSAVCVAVNSSNEVVIGHADSTGIIYKIDHTGEQIRTTKNFSDESALFTFLTPTETLKQIVVGPEDKIYVLTNQNQYTFDENLALIGSSALLYDDTIGAFSYNKTTSDFSFVLTNKALDVKFIEETCWHISSLDGNLYRNNELFLVFGDATNIAVDPQGRLWITHDTNKITVIDPEKPSAESTVLAFEVGARFTDSSNSKKRKKHINFINKFDRSTNSKQWLCVLYYSDERILYYYNLNGTLVNFVYINGLFNPYIIDRYKQSYEGFSFASTGDFTGYEQKRILKNLHPYNKGTNLVLKASFSDNTKKVKEFKTFKVEMPISNWENGSWQHLTVVFCNQTFTIYNNESKIGYLDVPDRYSLDYTNQPALYIGSPTGNRIGYNNELQCSSSIFNGQIGDFRIYNYALPYDYISFFVKSTISASDLVWYCPTPVIQYVEEIEQMYKHKLPGSKSSLFNLKIVGSGITNEVTKKLVETEIRTLIKTNKPAYSELLKIIWID